VINYLQLSERLCKYFKYFSMIFTSISI